MRKSSVTSRSSFPSGALSCHATSCGFSRPSTPRSLPSTPLLVPSRCLRKYSCPLPDEPSRLDRQTNMLRGQFAGSSGSWQDISSSPDRSAFGHVVLRCPGPLPGRGRRWSAGFASVAAPTAASPCARHARCSRSSIPTSRRRARSVTECPRPSAFRNATGRCARRRTMCRSCAAAGGSSRAPKATGTQPVCGRSFSCPT